MQKHWTLEDIPWHLFDAGRVDPELVKMAKAASLVEANAGDYAAYLCNVFADDPEFRRAACQWADEEVQHGRALARWAALADPGFDFDACFARFTAGYRIAVHATHSIRGSRSGELVARCIVETGTSTYYTALGEATAEPALREICRNIAADELRHYKLFYGHLKRYLGVERIGPWRRLRVALRRMWESEADDELSYAYYAANLPAETPYDRRSVARAYSRRAYGYYRRRHVERGIAMVLKAVGLRPNGRLNAVLTRLTWLLRRRYVRLERAAA